MKGFSANVKVVSFISGLFFLASCSTIPRYEAGTTLGEIHVQFPPRIASRERLLNDRLEQDAWYAKRLAEVDDSDLTIDGMSDLRNLSYISGQLKGQIDPAYQVYAEQAAQTIQAIRSTGSIQDATQQMKVAAVQQLTAKVNKGDLTYDQAKTQLDAMGIKMADINVGATTGPTFPTAPAVAAGIQTVTPGQSLFKADSTAGVVPPGSSNSKTSLPFSAIDRFHDLEALREAIRTARMENALDETHDMTGRSLYRLTFDVTVQPRNDTSALAVVELTTKSPEELQGNVIDSFRLAVEDDIDARISQRTTQIAQRMENDCAAAGDFTTAIQCAWVDLPKREQSYIWSQMKTKDFATTSPVFKLIKLGSNTTLSMDTVTSIKALLVKAEIARASESFIGCFVAIEDQPTDGVQVTLLKAAPKDSKNCPTFDGEATRGIEFGKLIYKQEATIRAYAVTPKETVQRLSELGSNRAAKELILGLSAAMPGGGASAALQSISANDAYYQAIRRQPLVVGFADVPNDRDAQVGWLLGPQFQLSTDGKAVAFRHSNKQQSLTATMSIPAWMNVMYVCVRSYWVKEDGTKYRADGSDTPIQQFGQAAVEKSRDDGGLKEAMRSVKAQYNLGTKANAITKDQAGRERTPIVVGDDKVRETQQQSGVGPQPQPDADDWCHSGKIVPVALPVKPSSLIAVMNDHERERPPTVGEIQDLVLKEGSSADILITGDNLWRSTEVYIGGQKADRTWLAPNMKGIQAHFDKVSAPMGSVVNGGKVSMTIFTSEGKAQFGTAAIIPAEDKASLKVVAAAPRIIVDSPYTFELSDPITSFAEAAVYLSDPNNQSYVPTSYSLQLAQDGRHAAIKIPAIQTFKSGAPVNLDLKVIDGPNRQARTTSVRQAVVYYSTEPTVTTALAGKPTPLVADAVLTFPQELFASYADLRTTPIAVRASAIINGETYDLTATQCKVNKNLSCKISVNGGADDIAKVGKISSFDVTFELDGADVPKVAKLSVAIP